jgi:CBS domain containing-hemolysin-like protein
MDKQRMAIWAALLILVALSAFIVLADTSAVSVADAAGAAIVELPR